MKYLLIFTLVLSAGLTQAYDHPCERSFVQNENHHIQFYGRGINSTVLYDLYLEIRGSEITLETNWGTDSIYHVKLGKNASIRREATLPYPWTVGETLCRPNKSCESLKSSFRFIIKRAQTHSGRELRKIEKSALQCALLKTYSL